MHYAFTINLTAFGTSKEIQIPLPNGLWGMTYFGFVHDGGSGAQVQPTVSERTNATAGSTAEEDTRYAPAATAKNTANRTQFDPPIPFNVTTEKLYLKINPNAGSDNTAKGMIVFVPIGSSMGSLT